MVSQFIGRGLFAFLYNFQYDCGAITIADLYQILFSWIRLGRGDLIPLILSAIVWFLWWEFIYI